ncbi:prepilin peptidase [Thermocoleostomius sinensis]|jgi:leader peptidase (prepilin peptidase)/N-methyltransferase|uniref:Prepilin leader peptidase/N-methyltransferase n=1 Tax=Thermocoleostomius sinensis A174 TaxID=2016057 RepID=A0A9E8ZCD9_9CYAN|nr:A24 family peptidase [Thermocoleostomius sinensis]WAL60276.1 A24 family peptidase [Thermocoleostomius sinensis A174]
MAALIVVLVIFALGASVGSFLNVVIYRLPIELSLLHPPSHCPHCGKCLKIYDNVPVWGWLKLKGRCRYCQHPIACRYVFVEVATGALFVFTFWAFSPSMPLLGYWVFFSWLIALALIDLDTMTLPNALTQSGLVAGLVFQAMLGWTDSGTIAGTTEQLWRGLIGAVVGIWLFDLITLVGSIVLGQTAMGGGDAKLAAMMGAWLGWQQLLLAGFLACVLGTIIGSGALALQLINRRQPMPFGPFLALGAVLTVFWGPTIVSAYQQLWLTP